MDRNGILAQRESFALILIIRKLMGACSPCKIIMASTGMPRRPYRQMLRLQEGMWFTHIFLWTRNMSGTGLTGYPIPGS